MTAILAALAMGAPTTPANSFDASRLAALRTRLREAVDAEAVSGVVVLVHQNGRMVFSEAYGLANRAERRPMKQDTIFQVMSMTKPIVAIAVVMCAELGYLNLDDPVEKYIPGFKDISVRENGVSRPPARRLTIRHLLTHTGGLGSIDPGGLDDDGKRKLPLSIYADLIPTEPLKRDPGTAMEYSGLGFSTLGRIVEIASKMPLERFMEERIFSPLGMRDTTFFLRPKDQARVAFTYVDGMKPLEANPFRQGAKLANPAGGLYSTANDMAILLQTISDGGRRGKTRLLSPAGIEAMTSVQTGNLLVDGSDGQGVGLGFFVVRSATGQSTLKSIGTFGHTGAFGTEFWADRKRGVVAVFMAQGLDNVSPVRRTFNTMLNAAFVKR